MAVGEPGVGAGVRRRRTGLHRHCAALEGYTLHAGVGIAPLDRDGLERLFRYVCRPPLPAGRLATTEDGRVTLTLKRPWEDGTTGFPPPSAHQVV